MRRYLSEATFRMPCAEGCKEVYLTIDDGPIPEVTPWLLDLLDELQVKVTFFVVGDNVRKYPHLYDELLRRGHRVGNHTMHHVQGIKMNDADYLAEVAKGAEYVESDLFRPPHGLMKRSQLKQVAQRYRVVMFDVVTRDYDDRVDEDRIVENVMQLARPGSVIVFHDSLRSAAKLRGALTRSIEWLRAEGYEFKLL